jgi:hypothetical protein
MHIITLDYADVVVDNDLCIKYQVNSSCSEAISNE